jgi:hypothetical protein
MQATLYTRMVGSFIYLTQPDLILCMQEFYSQVYGISQGFSLESWKKNPKVSCRDNQLWFVVHKF